MQILLFVVVFGGLIFLVVQVNKPTIRLDKLRKTIKKVSFSRNGFHMYDPECGIIKFEHLYTKNPYTGILDPIAGEPEEVEVTISPKELTTIFFAN